MVCGPAVLVQASEGPIEVLKVDNSGRHPRSVRVIRPGHSDLPCPSPKAVLRLPKVSPQAGVVTATTATDPKVTRMIGYDVSLMSKRDQAGRITTDPRAGANVNLSRNAQIGLHHMWTQDLMKYIRDVS
jgi:hypothetical protein